MKVFLITPVRSLTDWEKNAIEIYLHNLESHDVQVYWPYRDTDYSDPSGFSAFTRHKEVMKSADEVHIWWNPASEESVFLLGMAWAMGKRLAIANSITVKEHVRQNPGRSFPALMLQWGVKKTIKESRHEPDRDPKRGVAGNE